ncbi:MAG TPA: AarF/UbiB family protein [Acidimicrobiales bacterium]|nr:AarF/UbiB family protein [Acidimicrobiales bacterium]
MTHLAAVAAQSAGDLLLGWRIVVAVPLMLAIAVVAGRLLGVGQSVARTVLSAVVGLGIGTGIAVLVTDNRVDPDRFSRDFFLFSVFFTLSAVVWMELLSKPGALARAQSGLAAFPRPLHSMKRRSQRVRRYAEVSRIAARHGLGPLMGLARRGEHRPDQRSFAAHLRLVMEECGGMFVKLGQVLSTRADFVPADYRAEFARLQDNVPPVPRGDIEAQVEEELGAGVDEVFAHFDWEPLAAASIGQVYRATLRSGERVIVKVQRPGIDEAVERDLDVMLELARTVEARTSWAADYHVLELATEFADRLREELDFRIEARNATEIASRHRGRWPVHVPEIHAGLTTRKILVMEELDGVSVRDAAVLDAQGIDRDDLANALLRYSLHAMLVDGHFHADPHPGNVMVLADGRLGLIDFGATGRLDANQGATIWEMMLAISQRDAAMLRQCLLEVAHVPLRTDDEALERSLSRFMARNLASGEANAAMLNELLALLFSFGVVLPPEAATFFRALVTLEGTLVTLSPGYLVLDAAQDVAREMARERLSPSSLQEMARQELVSLIPLVRRMPRRFDRLASMLERGTLTTRMSLFASEDDVLLMTRWLNRAVLAFLGGVSGIMGVILLTIQGGPDFTGGTSLYQLFGYFAIFCSTILIMRVLVAILRDGVN